MTKETEAERSVVDKLKVGVYIASFPELREGGEKGPSFHCLRMHLIVVEFHWHHGPSIYVCILVMSKWTLNITWSTHLYIYHSSEYSVLSRMPSSS